MKFTTTALLSLTVASTTTQAFQTTAPTFLGRPASFGGKALKDSNSDTNIVEQAADVIGDAVDDASNAVQNALDGVGEAIDRADDVTPGIGVTGGNGGLSQDEEDEMWTAQRELQANRNKHSGASSLEDSKAKRAEKYSGEPIIENDKHFELKEPWTKSDGGDDHYSANGKL